LDRLLKRKADADSDAVVEYSRPAKKVKVDDGKKRKKQLRFDTVANSVHHVPDTYDLEKYREYNNGKSFTGGQIEGFRREVDCVQALWEHGRRQKAYDVSYTQINHGKACDVTAKNAQKRTEWTRDDTHLGDESIFLRSNLLFDCIQMAMDMLEKESSPIVWEKVGKHWVPRAVQTPSKSSSPTSVKKLSAPLLLQNEPFYASYKTKKDFEIVATVKYAAPKTAPAFRALTMLLLMNAPCFDQYKTALPLEAQALDDDDGDEGEIISGGNDDEGEVLVPPCSAALSIPAHVPTADALDGLGSQWVNGLRRSARHQPKMGSVYVNGLRRSARRLASS
jgi:hypothetical protein